MEFFPGVFSSWPKKKRHWEKKPAKNVSPNSKKTLKR